MRKLQVCPASSDMVNASSIIKICCLIQRPSFFISRGKLKRLVAQFGPYSWVDYDWRSTSSLGRWITMLGIIFVVSLKDS
jgi:Phosphatidyl serine synthase.